MGIEIEKKYSLTPQQKQLLERRLSEVEAISRGKEFEENTIFGGHGLDNQRRVLRLRLVGGRAVFTFKEKMDSASLVMRRREEETVIENPEALISILDAAGGFKPALVYEKYRTTWELADTQVTLDELAFGTFLEIEGDEEAISYVEDLLNIPGLKAESKSYPELAQKYGRQSAGLIEARF
jgi:predicted adenylyl cyclase CyaB